MRRNWVRAFLASSACLLCTGAFAVTLDFEGMNDLDPIQNFYNGGLSGGGAGAGPAYGITFSADAITVKDSDQGGSALGNFANEPSPDHVMSFLQNGGVTLNRTGGFTSALSFYYSAFAVPGSVSIFAGPNGTGATLATQPLAITPVGAGDPTGDFSTFALVNVPFVGIAQSAVFSGTNNEIAFDNVGLTLVPEPSGIVASLLVVAGLAASRRRLIG
ncbi:hypothetical protein Pla175_17420 [Pirellulimonas nuda]|uniref:PEP-CTERM protein-sorting domain-containing protein n=1 Tax=Pirellulimonas nuda TaxID=2528009 RepID=A0A518DA52_9BACT|nr:hypothetical protein [Pirellulimonas nuda]QDU88367.1 hypothetical protein Pla175_17420 [Pirellulimonas nuda]